MKNKKLIIMDLDGTLLDANQKCSVSTKQYLKQLQNMGHIIVIATGRILASAIKVTDGAEFADYIITDAGALIYDIKKKKEIFKATIDKNLAKQICNLYDEKLFNYIDICDTNYYNKLSLYSNNYNPLVKLIGNIDDFLEICDGITHMTINLKNDDIVEPLINKLNKEIGILNYQIMKESFSDKKWIEIAHKNVSKYSSIKLLLQLENINNEDTIAFGDSLNDIDMIQNCGVGVAMGNALDEIKKIADYTTLSHNNDGVKVFLENYL